MDSLQVHKKFLSAKKRFTEELAAIQKEYIESHYNFKEGDIVRFKNGYCKNPTLVAIDSLYFNDAKYVGDERAYKNPIVAFAGHVVDEEGYNVSFFRGSNQLDS